MHTIDKNVEEECRNIIYFDLETQKSAQEVGGWSYIDRMKLAIAATFSTADQQYTTFQEADVEQLIDQLTRADLIVGFNLKGFDYVVLRPYTRVNLWQLPTFDMLEYVRRALGFRLSLDALAKETLRESKSADGLQSLRWWKAGKVDLVAEYCRKDVEITKRLHEYALQHGHLLFRGRDGRVRRVNTTGW
ncbi:helicase [Candidatus Poribacteria bacterium]|nr:helicase [Candidatus Poribacteria bacterium]